MVTVAAPAARLPAHPRDLILGHGLSLGCMAVMVLGLLPAWAAPVTAAGFAVALAWCLLRVLGGRARAAYLRLGVCCLAMAVMLVPSGGGPSTAAMPGMAGGSMPGHVGASGGSSVGVVHLMMAAALVVVVVTALLAVRRGGARRSAALAEGLLAGLMAAMLLGNPA